MPSPAPARGPRKRKIGSAYTGPAEAERSLPPKRTRLPAPLPPAGPSTPGWAWEGQQAPAADAPPAGPEPEQRDAATLAGWATRRRHFAASWARLADLSSADASLLPSDDLLNALHAHTAALYASHGLLAPVGSKTRKYTYLSRKKRALLVEGVLARPGPKASKRESTRSLYKRREMRACFEGNALLALGVLVEEMVRAELKDAGYLPLGRRAGEDGAEGVDGEPRDGDGTDNEDNENEENDNDHDD